jgi:sugar/nucleoside kinase (ribokinase family)
MKNSKAILQVPGTMKIISAEIPVPKEDEVLIKVEYVGICGSDVHGFESGPFIPPKDPNQEIGLGHECAGTVVAVGSRVRKFKPGDRVNIEPGVPCGHCRYCLEGKYNICPDVDFMATQPNYRGALTHYLCHPESFTYKLPDNMDTMEGALVEPAAVGMHAAMLADVKPGKKIIILGAGCIGERTFVTNRNGSLWKLNIDDVDFARFSQAKLLSLASIFNSPLLDGRALTEIFTQAKTRQMIICADMIKPRLNETLNDICEALSYVDYLFPNFAEAKLLTGKETLDEIADCFLACGVKTVVIKTGKDGCFIKRGDMTMKVPAVAGITAIDTIGAGDNFASGFIAALLEGKNLRECARFANATAAISVLSIGATTGVKNRKLVEQLLEEYEG